MPSTPDLVPLLRTQPMKTQINNRTTRASLAATAAYNNRWFAGIVSATAVLSGANALAADWTGDTSADWNDNLNWSADLGTNGENAIINDVSLNVPVISADTVGGIVDIIVGNDAGLPGGSPGQVNHNAGSTSTGAGNWAFVGTNGGTGIYNLADTTNPGAGISGFAKGTGNFNSNGRLYVGGFNAVGSTGTFNVNTSGTLSIASQLQIGSDGSTGVFNLEDGTVTTGGEWVEIGNGAGTDGTFNMSGGSFTKVGNDHFIVASNGGTGEANVSGGTININNEIWVGQSAGSVGVLNISDSGSITNGSWVAIGRGNGTGTVNMTGGSWIKTGGGQFIVGSDGPGTMTQSGGLVDVQSGYTWVGEAGGATTAVLTISGTAEFRSPYISVGPESPDATLNLDGGVVRTHRFGGTRDLDGGALTGTGLINFNGSQIIATQADEKFIGSSIDSSVIGAGGLLVDSNGFDLSGDGDLTGTGGVVKTGEGTLSLLGINNTYAGDNAINAGGLVLSADFPGSTDSPGNITLADGTSLGVTALFGGDQLSPGDVTFGSSAATSLDLGLNDLNGSNPTDALLNVTGALAVNGDVTVNVTGTKFEVNDLVLVSYDNTARSGAGSFLLGSLPSGVVATIVDDPNYFGPNQGAVYLDITSVALPRWNGDQDANWTTALNWIDQASGSPSTYNDPDPVLFDDDAEGTTDVVLNGTVAPASVTFFNDFDLDYTLSGTGKITGSTGLLKQGALSLTLGDTLLNDFTGSTRLEGGTTSVGLLTNAATPGPLGLGDLVLAGGTLNYTGPAVTTDRGFSVAASEVGTVSGLSLASDVTMSGPVTATVGKLNISGAGVLTLTNPGANVLAAGGGGDPASLTIDGAGLVLNGTGQTNTVGQGTWLASAENSNTSLTVSGDTALNLNARLQIALGLNSTGNVVVEDSGSLTKTGGWLSIGNSSNGVGTMTVRDNGTVTADGDFNVSDVGTSQGTLNIQDNAEVNSTGTAFIGKNTGTVGALNISGGTYNGATTFVADGETSSGTITQTGGTVNIGGNNLAYVGQRGTAVWNQSAGEVNVSGWLVIGRLATSNGTVNVSGGTFNQTQVDRNIILAEEGVGTLTISGTGTVVSDGGQVDMATNGGTGTLNLNAGGTLSARRIADNNGTATSIFNFDGGTLIANTNANVDFMAGLTTATINAGGGTIDSNGQDIAISQVLGGTGSLTKTGAGVLTLSGANTYEGDTTISVGTLSATSTFFSDTATVSIADGAFLDLPHGSTDLVGSLVIDGTPVVDGTYGAADFPAAITGAGFIQVGGTLGTAYDSWISSFFPGETDPLIIGDDADPDNDGQANSLEFALGGAPNDGSDNAKIFSLTEDGSVDGDADSELLMTIAVRSGTPAFAGSPSPSATQDTYVYTIEGSNTLADFPEIVTPVDPVTTGLPAAPAGYEYRTFSLNGSNGLTTKGFLRVNVTSAE